MTLVEFVIERSNGSTYPYPKGSKVCISKSSISAVMPTYNAASGIEMCGILIEGKWHINVYGSYEEVLEKIGWNVLEEE